jgi:hypothetical protein
VKSYTPGGNRGPMMKHPRFGSVTGGWYLYISKASRILGVNLLRPSPRVEISGVVVGESVTQTKIAHSPFVS